MFAEHSRELIPASQTCRKVSPPRREERARGQRPNVAAGGGRAGTGSRGILGRSGDLVRCQARPPSAWLEAKGRVRLQARPLRPLELAGNGGVRVPVRPQQGHLTGRWRITVARSVLASSKRYSIHLHRTLSGAPHPFPTRARKARGCGCLPHLTCFARRPPPEGEGSPSSPSGGGARQRGGGESGDGPPTPQAPT